MKFGSYNLLTDKLEPPFLEALRQVETYGTVHMVPDEVMAEKMMELLDTMLAAQEAGAAPEQVVGRRIQDFCMNFFSDVSGKDIWSGVLSNFGAIFRVIFVFELVLVVLDWIKDGPASLQMETRIKPYLVGLAAGWGGNLVGGLFGCRALRRGKYNHRNYILINLLSTVVFGVAAYALLAQLPPMRVKVFVLLAVSGGYIVLDALVRGIVRFRRTGDFRKKKNDYEISFTGAVKQEIQTMDTSRDLTVVKTFAKRYTRTNRRRAKKGQPPLTTPAFLESDYRKDKLSCILSPLGGVAVAFLFVFLNEEGFDASLFLLILCLMTLPVAWILRKMLKITAKEVAEIQAACAQYGVELDEYAQMLKDGKI